MSTDKSTATATARPPADTSAADKSGPIERFQFESVIASVFAREITTKAGKPMTVYNVSLQRGYTDKDGTKKYTESLRRDDLLAGSKALSAAYDFINNQVGAQSM